MRVRLGTIALTSRMILGFAAASNASSLTLNTVFSLGFSWVPRRVHFHSTTQVSTSSNNVPLRSPQQPQLLKARPPAQQRAWQSPGCSAVTVAPWGETCTRQGDVHATRVEQHGRTLSSVTRSAA